MGVIVKYKCKQCGVIADDIFLGPGWTCYQEPVICKDCGNIMSTSINESTRAILPQYAHCKRCGGSNLIIWDHKCPKCGKTEIEEDPVGMWD